MSASAPGKVFVLGEYAVALGVPAIVAAVDRRLGCRASTRPGAGRLVVRAVGEPFSTSLEAETLDGVPAGHAFAVAAALVSARRLGLRGVDVDLRTWSDLDDVGPKPGLGGSAAVVAATVAAVHALAGRPREDPHVLAAVGVAAHRLAQGGGSGADVVASTLGGIQLVADLDAAAVPATVSACQTGVSLRAETLVLPTGLALEVVATGEGAATGPRIRRFVERVQGRAGRRAGAARVLQEWSRGMGVASSQFALACRDADVDGALRAGFAARRLLERLGALTGIRIWSEGLRRACAALPSDAGVCIKPSGAGGGDCAVALARGDRRESLRSAWRRAGLHPLEVESSLRGVSVVVREGGAPHA